MNAKLEKGNITIDCWDLLTSISGERDLTELIETLSCQEKVIKHVADQILDGFTENIYSGAEHYGIEPRTELDFARARVIKLAPEVAQKEINKLKSIAEREKKNAEEYSKKYWSLFHSWPRGYSMPKDGDDF